MKDEEIIKACDLLSRLNGLSSTAGTVLLFAAQDRDKREKFLSPGGIFDKFAQLALDARDAMKPLGDPNLSSLLDELANECER